MKNVKCLGFLWRNAQFLVMWSHDSPPIIIGLKALTIFAELKEYMF